MRRCDCPLRMQRNLVHDLYFAHIAPLVGLCVRCWTVALPAFKPKTCYSVLLALLERLARGRFLRPWDPFIQQILCVFGAPSEAVCFRAGNVDHLVVLYSCVGSSVSMKGNSMVQACVCFAADRRFASVHRDPRAS